MFRNFLVCSKLICIVFIFKKETNHKNKEKH
jgi:hypothetical protein